MCQLSLSKNKEVSLLIPGFISHFNLNIFRDIYIDSIDQTDIAIDIYQDWETVKMKINVSFMSTASKFIFESYLI